MAQVLGMAGDGAASMPMDPAGQLIAAWDGARALSVVVRDAPALITGYLFQEGEAGRYTLACRRRLQGEGDLVLDSRQLQPGAGAVVMLRRAGGEVTSLQLRLDPSARPADGVPATRLTLGDRLLMGVNQEEGARGGAGTGGVARLLVGPFMSQADWARRSVRLALARETDRLVLSGLDGERADLVRVAFVSRRAGWRFVLPDEDGHATAPRPGEGEAVLLLGQPGVALSLTGPASPAMLETATPETPAPRELALVAAADGTLVAVVLDEAMRAATGSSLATLDGGSGRALTVAGQTAPANLRTPFSPYDPNVQAARRAVQDAAGAREGWPEAGGWTHPFAAGGWPPALSEAVTTLALQDQARLVDWTLADPLLGRLMAAVRLVPDRDLAPADAERLREAIVPLAAPDAPDMLRAAAVAIADAAARRRVLEVAAELGRGWLPLSLAEAALAAARVEPVDHGARLPADAARAARALLARWEDITGDIGLMARFDPAQDPLRGAARLLDAPGLEQAVTVVPVLARLAADTDAQVAELLAGPLAGQPESKGVAAALRAAGRYLALRHLVALTDVAAGLARTGEATDAADEDMLLRLAVLRRMRAALPEGLATYLALAGANTVPPVERQLAERWGQP